MALRDIHGELLTIKDVGSGAPIEFYKTQKLQQMKLYIWWNKIPAIYCRPHELNLELDTLDKTLKFVEVDKGYRTIVSVAKICSGYFVRKAKNDKNWVEICGIRPHPTLERDSVVFRYKVKAENADDDMPAYMAYSIFKKRVQEHFEVSLRKMFGNLPEDFQIYRDLVPKPVNFAFPDILLKEISGCTKADISSAYGFEASKDLPDLHEEARKIVNGRVEPSEEYPFAFYLKSKKMAIFGEGDSDFYGRSIYVDSGYIDWNLKAADDVTLLCKKAKYSLREVFEELFAGRKENPDNKKVMNFTIGMWHRKKISSGDDNYWPLAAVVKFRCNKRIVDLCDELLKKRQIPILINTDSITWIGSDQSCVDKEKFLGSFTLEYANCRVIIKGPKAYQISWREDGEDKVLTRWSGPHSKEQTEKLKFGDILRKEVLKKIDEEEKKNTYRWDDKKRRFVNMYGDPLSYEDYYSYEEKVWGPNEEDF